MLHGKEFNRGKSVGGKFSKNIKWFWIIYFAFFSYDRHYSFSVRRSFNGISIKENSTAPFNS